MTLWGISGALLGWLVAYTHWGLPQHVHQLRDSRLSGTVEPAGSGRRSTGSRVASRHTCTRLSNPHRPPGGNASLNGAVPGEMIGTMGPRRGPRRR